MSSVQHSWEQPAVMPFAAVGLEEPRWFAIHTLSRHEKKVAVQLRQKDIPTFLPLVTRIHRWSDRRKAVELPLFSGYVFVRVVPSAQMRLLVLQNSGVVGFVGSNGEGTPIPSKQIDDIRAMLAHDSTCAPHPYLRVGQRVRIRGGCLDDVEGILVAHNDGRSLVLSVELLQRSVAIRLDGYDVETI